MQSTLLEEQLRPGSMISTILYGYTEAHHFVFLLDVDATACRFRSHMRYAQGRLLT